MAVGEFLDPFDVPPVPPEPIQLTSTDRHGWVRDPWDKDAWGNIIPGAGIRYN